MRDYEKIIASLQMLKRAEHNYYKCLIESFASEAIKKEHKVKRRKLLAEMNVKIKALQDRVDKELGSEISGNAHPTKIFGDSSGKHYI